MGREGEDGRQVQKSMSVLWFWRKGCERVFSLDIVYSNEYLDWDIKNRSI